MGEEGEPYKRSAEDILKEFGITRRGLFGHQITLHTKKYGLNSIERKKKFVKTRIFLNQFKDIMVLILLAATLISIILNDTFDAMIIIGIVIFNAIFGFIQEYRAESSIEALRRLTNLRSRVMRDGKEIDIDSSEIVPGDIIILETGNKIPADARIIEESNLEVDESILTGESRPVDKTSGIIEHDAQLAERANMVFRGTIVTKGRAHAVVVGTGFNTEVGKIAQSLADVKEEKTPLQSKLARLSKIIGVIVLAISAVVFLLNAKTQGYLSSLIFGISLAVAAIPEGLPAVVTVAFALGVRKMIKKRALIRKLASIETLGSVDVICTDKTGTLTKNEMTVTKLFSNGKIIDVGGQGYNPSGTFMLDRKDFDPKKLDSLLRCAALCNDAKLEHDGERWRILGDPTEGALIVAARKAGLDNQRLALQFPRIDEQPFDSARKYMVTVHKSKSKKLVLVKGAPEAVLSYCSKIEVNGKAKTLTDKGKAELMRQYKEFAADALRVLAFAYKETASKEKYEKNLTFIGLAAMLDPPRDEVAASITAAKQAGIRTVMITGDYAETAKAIASNIGIEGKFLSGADLDGMDDDALIAVIEEVGIYARVNPEHKLRIVDALQRKGHVVAMTGDGVNDAPALKKANVGVALGSGTDVAKEASHMIITDDNFTDIVAAIEEGRGIFDNIRKFITYMLSCNIAEIFVILSAMLFSLPSPLSAAQILWLNIVTDGLPALALSLDPKESNVMLRRPRRRSEGILTRNLAVLIFSLSLFLAVGALFLIKYALIAGSPDKIRTLVFTALVVFEMVMIFVIRKEFRVRFFSNRYLFYAVLSSIALQLALIYSPLSAFFRTVPLNSMDWFFIGVIGVALALASLTVKKLLDLVFGRDTI